MRAKRHGAMADDLFDEPHGPRLDRVGQLAPQRLFSRDSLLHAVAGPVRDEGQAEQRLVEMDMALDEAGKHQRAVQSGPLYAGRGGGGAGIGNLRDAAVGNRNVGAASGRKPRVDEDHPPQFISRHAISRTRRAATSL